MSRPEYEMPDAEEIVYTLKEQQYVEKEILQFCYQTVTNLLMEDNDLMVRLT